MCILFPVEISDLKFYPCFECYYLGLQSCRAALGLDTSSLHKVPVTQKCDIQNAQSSSSCSSSRTFSTGFLQPPQKKIS